MNKKPNILFVFSDQQRWDTVSCYHQPLGAAFNLTPNLDRLAAEGTCFLNAMTCQPVCGPARACLQTGKYPTRVGCHVNDMMLPLTETGIAHYFNAAGYETAYVGKWHLASHHAIRQGYSDRLDLQTKAIPPEYRGGYKNYWVAADVFEFTSHGYGGFMFDGAMNKRTFSGYRGDATTDFALEYLSRSKDKPFFLFISYIEPHHQNDRNCFEGPKGSKERFQAYTVPGDLQGAAGDWQEHLPDYLGCCRNLDDNVGRLILALKETGQYDNTIIFYTSDHGCHFRTRNAEYKRSCHDASLHVPLIAKGGCFDGGHTVKELTSLIDLAPTLLASANIAQPDYMSGIPLQQLVEKPGAPIRQDVFVQISESCVGRALRTPEWTYAVEAPTGTDPTLPDFDRYEERYLYDLAHDPFQKENVIKSTLHSDVRSMLRMRLLDLISTHEGKQPQIIDRY
jgi:uncharacterized sulfatase